MIKFQTDTAIGDIPSDWGKSPLRQLLLKYLPGNWGEDRGEHYFQTIRSTNLTNHGHLDLSDVAIRSMPLKDGVPLQPLADDIFLERSGGGPGQPVGRVGLVRADMPGFAFSNFLQLLRPNKHLIHPVYLCWVLYLLNRNGRIVRLEQQTTQMRNLHFRDYLTVVVPVPPPPEQQAIVRIFDAADDSIERTRASLNTAQKMRTGLARALLSFGVDENGRMRDPPSQPNQFHPTSVGKVPVAWRISQVSAEFDLATGFTLGEHRRPKVNKRRYLRVANVQRERIDIDDVLELEADEREMDGRRLELGDLLIVEGHANPYEIGRCATVKDEAVGLTFQNHLFRLRSKGKISFAFGCHWLNSDFARRYWRRKCGTSSGLNTINQRMLKSMPVAVPDEKEQERIVALLDAADRRIQNESERLKSAEKLKRGLMQDLLTGRVRVKPLVTSDLRSRP